MALDFGSPRLWSYLAKVPTHAPAYDFRPMRSGTMIQPPIRGYLAKLWAGSGVAACVWFAVERPSEANALFDWLLQVAGEVKEIPTVSIYDGSAATTNSEGRDIVQYASALHIITGGHADPSTVIVFHFRSELPTPFIYYKVTYNTVGFVVDQAADSLMLQRRILDGEIERIVNFTALERPV